eukprot:5209208-Heterocapsa_arctica.AAC.1
MGRFKHGMEDTAQSETDRQNFSRLYGLAFDKFGQCHTRLEGAEQHLYRLKESLVPEQTEEHRQGWASQRQKEDMAEALAESLITEEKEAIKRQEEAGTLPHTSEEVQRRKQEEELT